VWAVNLALSSVLQVIVEKDSISIFQYRLDSFMGNGSKGHKRRQVSSNNSSTARGGTGGRYRTMEQGEL